MLIWTSLFVCKPTPSTPTTPLVLPRPLHPWETEYDTHFSYPRVTLNQSRISDILSIYTIAKKQLLKQLELDSKLVTILRTVLRSCYKGWHLANNATFSAVVTAQLSCTMHPSLQCRRVILKTRNTADAQHRQNKLSKQLELDSKPVTVQSNVARNCYRCKHARDERS